MSEVVDGDVTVVAVRGEIDVATAPAFARMLLRAQQPTGSRVVIDLGETLFIGATGLAVLLNALRRTTHCGGRMAIACSNPTVLRLFDVTKTSRTFAMFPDREGAIDHVRGREAVVLTLPSGRARRARDTSRGDRATRTRRPGSG